MINAETRMKTKLVHQPNVLLIKINQLKQLAYQPIYSNEKFIWNNKEEEKKKKSDDNEEIKKRGKYWY